MRKENPMSVLDKVVKSIFPPRPSSRYYQFQVKCKRCGEIFNGKVDLYNELSQDFESEVVVHFCRKVLMGSGPCFQQVEAIFKFDENRNMTERQITGGEFVER
jgi:hypothetical protein